MSSRWAMLAILTMARTAMGFQFQAVGSASPHLVDALGIDYATIGFLVGLYLLPGVVLALPGGILGQRYGEKQVVLVGLGLMALGGLLGGVAPGLTVLVAARVLSGIGAVLLNVLLTKMVTDWFAGRELVLAMSILVNSWPFGIGLALVTLSPLAEATGWPAVSIATAVVALVSLVPLAVLYRQPETAAAPGTGRRGLSALSLPEIALASLAGLIWAFYNVGYAILLGFAPTFLIGAGVSAGQAGLMLGLTSWAFVASIQAGGLLGQRSRRTTGVMVTGFAALAAGLFLLPLSPSPYLPLVLIGALAGLPAGAIVALPGEFLRPENRAPGLGLVMTWYYVAMATLPAFAGWLRDTSGVGGVPFRFGAVLVLAAIPTLWILQHLQSRLAGRIERPAAR